MASSQTGIDELFTTGLKNAHAMENQALSIMEPQVARIENYPEVARRLQQHIEETRAQRERLESLLEGQSTSSSSLKDMALSFAGSMAALGHTVMPDEILKNSFANYAFEHFEIASYKSLLTLAEAGGFNRATSVLQQNLAEEQDMAQWLDQNLGAVTLQYAGLRQAGETAKR